MTSQLSKLTLDLQQLCVEWFLRACDIVCIFDWCYQLHLLCLEWATIHFLFFHCIYMYILAWDENGEVFNQEYDDFSSMLLPLSLERWRYQCWSFFIKANLLFTFISCLILSANFLCVTLFSFEDMWKHIYYIQKTVHKFHFKCPLPLEKQTKHKKNKKKTKATQKKSKMPFKVINFLVWTSTCSSSVLSSQGHQ